MRLRFCCEMAQLSLTAIHHQPVAVLHQRVPHAAQFAMGPALHHALGHIVGVNRGAGIQADGFTDADKIDSGHDNAVRLMPRWKA